MGADLKYALRFLRRSPGFAIVAVVSLALGIGANTAIFSLVDAVLLRPLPVADPDALVDIFTTGGDGDEYATTSYPDFLDLKANATVFSDMAAYTPMFAPLNLGDRSRLVMGQIVTSNHFEFFGVRPFLGRLLHPADDAPGAERVVVISHRMWRTEYGADPAVAGRTLVLRGLPYTIVGVAPPDFSGVIPLLAPELWLPIAHNEEVEPAGINSSVPSPGRTRMERRGSRWLFVKARLRPGVSIAEARANVVLVGQQLASAYPDSTRNSRMSVFPTRDVRLLVPQASAPLSMGSAMVMAVVGLVLLIACANVAGMLLARAASRRREIAVRIAVGATRWHVVRQLLAEGIVLGVCGALVAMAFAWALVRALLSIRLPVPGVASLEVPLDLRVFGFALVLALAAGLLAALAPALKAASMRVSKDLRGEVATARLGRRRLRLRDVLVAGQLSLTAVLLVLAGLFVRTLMESQAADVGFRASGLAIVSADPAMARYPGERSEEFWRQALGRVAAMGEVESVALATPRLPFDLNFNQTAIRIDGKAYGPDDRGEVVSNVAVSPEYFATLDIPIVEGRGFAESDTRDAPVVAVINQSMARRFWPGGSAVGRTFELWFGGQKVQVVGVVRDYKLHTIAEQTAPYVHFAIAQRGSSYRHLVARTRGNAAQLVSTIRRELLAMEPNLVFLTSETMDDAVSMALLPQRVAASLVAGFGAVGTLLAAIGLYGVIAFSVSRRTREIGVRVAVGAGRRDVLGLVLREGMTLAVIGAVSGMLVAAAIAQGLQGVLYGVGAFDLVAWGVALTVLLSAAAAANLVPAMRAIRLDPVTALRTE
jgi:predicted permease